MLNEKDPSNHPLPSKGKLVKSTVLAFIIALVLLITTVLPAEYGIDPTGIGRLIGLKKMGDIKVSLAMEKEQEPPEQLNESTVSPETALAQAEPEPVPKTIEASQLDTRENTMTITLKPNQGKEIKLTMKKGAKVDYAWWTNGGKANFDAHADSKKLNIRYHNYSKGSQTTDEGTMEAAFDGKHGWFWRNRTSEDMVVTLKVTGQFTEIDQLN